MSKTAEEVIAEKFPNADQATRDAIHERASKTSKEKDGVGIALVTGASLDSLIRMAEFDIRNTDKAAPKFSADDLDRVRLASLGWGKNTSDAQKLTARGQFARKYGDAAAAAEDQKWPRKNPADPSMLAPRKNPYKKVPGLKKALRGDDNPLAPTQFNQEVHGALPPAPKLSKEQRKSNPFMPGPTYNLTKGGELFKSDPALARQLAAMAGVKL